jgi:hypothetical protein
MDDHRRRLGPAPLRTRAWYEEHAALSPRASADATGCEHMLEASSDRPLCGYAGPLTPVLPGHGRPCEYCTVELEARLRGRT